jgi:integrase
VPSAKRRDDRGLDRTLWVTNPDLVDALRAAADAVQREFQEPGGVKRLQRRLDTAARRLWPRRRAQITFYSMRHQLGSELKGSGLSDAQVAAVMGHRSVESVEVYGNRKRGGQGLGISVSPDESTVAKVNPGQRSEPGPKAPERGRERGHDGPGLTPS